MSRMQNEVNEFVAYVKKELARGLGDWEQRLNTALVPVAPADLGKPVHTEPPDAAVSHARRS
jgi:hypothetical protein